MLKALAATAGGICVGLISDCLTWHPKPALLLFAVVLSPIFVTPS
jgi:hypothetical protein